MTSGRTCKRNNSEVVREGASQLQASRQSVSEQLVLLTNDGQRELDFLCNTAGPTPG